MPGNKTKKIKEDKPLDNGPKKNEKKEKRATIKKKIAEKTQVEPEIKSPYPELPSIVKSIMNAITGNNTPPPKPADIPKKKGRKPKIRITEEPITQIQPVEIPAEPPVEPQAEPPVTVPKKKGRKPRIRITEEPVAQIQPVEIPAEPQVDPPVEPQAEPPAEPQATMPKKKGRKPRIRITEEPVAQIQPVEIPAEPLAEPPVEPQATVPKKKGRKPRIRITEEPVTQIQPVEIPAEPLAEPPATVPKKKGRKPKNRITEEPVAQKEEMPPQVMPVVSEDGKTRRCKNKYRMNHKTGFCELKTENVNKTRKQRTKKIPEKPVIIQDIQGEELEDIQDIAEIIPQDNIVIKPQKTTDAILTKNAFLKRKEAVEWNDYIKKPDDSLDFLYPSLNDPLFSLKIAKRKEFFHNRYDGTLHDVRKQANLLCNAEFQLMPHQLFVKNFMSLQTPYNSLLLYHSLGSGKTCSAIGIAEETRAYMKQVGIRQRIIVVASPNVQANFRLQLFDERRLKKVPNPHQAVSGIMNTHEDVWDIDSCVGNSLLKEINPANLKGLSREKVITQINTIINTSYVFMGYGQLANHISDKITVDKENVFSEKEKNDMEIKNINRYFNNRLIIIDEVHNIRLTDENNNKKTAMLLMKIAKHTDNLRFLFLSATPMFNSYKEIIWLTNLMNLNDKRSIIEISDVFDKDGKFKESSTAKDGTQTEGGKELLQRKLNGYVSYVRGENPYTFPFRVYPDKFSVEDTFETHKYPSIQMNGKPVDEPIKHIKLYLNQVDGYQNNAYNIIIEHLRQRSYNTFNLYGEMREMPSFENMESFGYTVLQNPLMSLNIIYPNKDLDKYINSQTAIEKSGVNEKSMEEVKKVITNSIGLQGLSSIMKWDESYKPQPIRHNFEYTAATLKKYGPIFSPENIPKYSAKINNICNCIRNSKGIVIIYSQFIDGGIVPIALALEEMGITRYSSHVDYNKPLFKKKPAESVDANTMKTRGEMVAEGGDTFNPAKYIIITGEKAFSPSNAADIKQATNPDNLNGEKIKVILISKAGSEGLDFKNVRQIHVLDPWYNMNRIEQIIGRGVRNLSHCQLPFEERNVEIYLHGTLLENNEEAADLYVYRLAEKKALQIGKVTRVLKESSVDCILNIGQSNFTADKLAELAENQNIQINLSSRKTIDFRIGDQPFTDMCDYMDNCEYKCIAQGDVNENNLIQDTYSDRYVKINNGDIVKKIRNLFREQTFYKRDVLIDSINISKQFPVEDQIFYALTYLINNKNEYITDKYGRQGNLVNRGEYYMFQPLEITDENASIYDRTVPVEYKRENIKLELPSVTSEPESAIKPTKKQGKKASTTESPEQDKEVLNLQDENMTHEAILNKIYTNYRTVFSETPAAINTGEKNWYKHANRVMEHLQTVYNIPEEYLERYVIYHMLDLLMLKDKMVLLEYIYSDTRTPMSDPLENKIVMEIEKYFNKRIMNESGRTAIILNKDNTWKIFMKPDEDENDATTEWKEGEPEDYRFFDRELDKYVLDDDKINNLVGFVNMFKKREMVFKIKDLRQARNNVGARCGDSTIKSEVIKLLNTLLERPANNAVYDDSTEIFHFGLCVIIEVLMRYFTDTNKNGKIYFLSPEETAVNDIVKFSR